MEVNGVIEAPLPRGLYRVKADNGHTVTVSVDSSLRDTTVRLLPGERVVVRLSPRNPNRGRISKRTV